MKFTQPTGFGILYGNLTTLISLTVSFFFRWLPCKNIWPTDAFSQIAFMCMSFYRLIFLFWKSTENKLRSKKFRIGNDAVLWMIVMKKIKNKICEWLLFGFSYLNILFFVSDLFFFCQFCYISFPVW